ncbi:hypothetical protein MP638_002606 [Amoeboaphelidium occidentale]|nr:hypothetical protein MP638_002606 [Amoeboaphelidium occidentale]
MDIKSLLNNADDRLCQNTVVAHQDELAMSAASLLTAFASIATSVSVSQYGSLESLNSSHSFRSPNNQFYTSSYPYQMVQPKQYRFAPGEYRKRNANSITATRKRKNGISSEVKNASTHQDLGPVFSTGTAISDVCKPVQTQIRSETTTGRSEIIRIGSTDTEKIKEVPSKYANLRTIIQERIKSKSDSVVVTEFQDQIAAKDRCSDETRRRRFSSSLKKEQPPVVKENNRRKYVCRYEDCEGSFPSDAHRKRHERSHNGSRPFECVDPGNYALADSYDIDCSKRFSRKDNMLIHAKKHANLLDGNGAIKEDFLAAWEKSIIQKHETPAELQ